MFANPLHGFFFQLHVYASGPGGIFQLYASGLANCLSVSEMPDKFVDINLVTFMVWEGATSEVVPTKFD